MLSFDEKKLLEEYKKAFKGYYRNKTVIDLDKKLRANLDSYLIRLEDSVPSLKFNLPPYRQSKYMILYVMKGTGEKTIGKIKVKIKDRTLMIVAPYITSSSSYSNDVKGYNFTFNLKFFLQEQFPKHHLLKWNLFNPALVPCAYPDVKVGNYLTGIFESILDEISHSKKYKEEMIALKTLEVLLVCERITKIKTPGEKTYKPPLLVQYIELIQEHYKEEHSTRYYAQKLHIHPNSLNTATNRYLQQSAKSVIEAKLVNEAQVLLNQTTLSVKEIAYELGFHSPSYFFRFFKKYTGKTPATYRAAHLKL